MTIDEQFEKIREKFGEPSIVIRTEEEEERERQKLIQKFNSKKAVAKRRGGDDLLDLNIPPPSFESGYSTWIEGSSVDTVSEASSLKNVLSLDQAEHFFAGDNTLLPSNTQDYKASKILQDAMTGQNLLGMMEEPKAKFNRPRDMQGNDALDLFIDPIAIFGSDRHPALQEVLQQLDLCKKFRGDCHLHLLQADCIAPLLFLIQNESRDSIWNCKTLRAFFPQFVSRLDFNLRQNVTCKINTQQRVRMLGPNRDCWLKNAVTIWDGISLSFSLTCFVVHVFAAQHDITTLFSRFFLNI